MKFVPLDIIDEKVCCGCSACADICSVKAIKMQSDARGFLRPMVNLENCVQCNKCHKVCPINSSLEEIDREVEIIACKNKDIEVRRKSSSGGVFWAIACNIITEGGVVYGAVLDNDMVVRHKRVTDIVSLMAMRGSKYVQSEIGNTYALVREDLRLDRKVLFTGTPCQVAAIKHSLENVSDKNLLCIEVACHGVPSPKVFAHYLKWLENQANSAVIKFDFRNKRNGWQHYELVATFKNGTEYRVKGGNDPYQRGFIQNLYIRSSCTSCRFKHFKAGADIMLGDFWGSGVLGTEYNDDKGISLVIIESECGMNAFNSIADSLFDVRPISLNVATAYNPCIISSINEHPKAAEFFAQVGNVDFGHLVEKLLDMSSKRKYCYDIAHRIKNLMMSIIRNR